MEPEERLVACIRKRIGLCRWAADRPWVLMCIGTDRLTGDALGPLVGTMVSEAYDNPFHVYGTLADPVHAVNLREKLEEVENRHQKYFMIAVDACLGQSKNIGAINVGVGPIRPGTGVKKLLPPVGHMYVTGVVNAGGNQDQNILQNTRLHLVLRQAKIISAALLQVAREERARRIIPLPIASRHFIQRFCSIR
ncbi:MAG: spore protease YyaC [Bacillota bacterium]